MITGTRYSDDPPQLRRVVVVLALIAVATGMLTGCTGSVSASLAQAPSMTSVRLVLASFADAIRTRDRATFLSDLDPHEQRFRAEQTTDYTSLARLPFRLWNYTIVGEIRDAGANRAATKEYGAPVRLVHVTLQFAFAGVEPVPSRHDQYLVFTERDGRTYLAGDDAVANENLASWVGPWRYGPLTAVAGKHSLVLGAPAEEDQLTRLAGEIDTGIAKVTAVWGTDWSRSVVAIVPASATEYTALTGAAVRESSAAAVTEGIDTVTQKPYGQRLVLNPTQLGRLRPVGRSIVLAHEITHLATAAVTADITPRWLVEGFAEYVANLGTGQAVRTAASELRAAIYADRVPSALPSDAAFGAGGALLAQQYEQAWLACRLIAAKVGRSGLVRLYKAVGTALAPRPEAIAAAFRTVLHETVPAFQTQWRAYLVAELGRPKPPPVKHKKPQRHKPKRRARNR